MEKICDVLSSIGLNPREIQVYLALMRYGTAPASVVGLRTGMARTTAQYTCQLLVKRGLVQAETQHGTLHFTADTPERLLQSLEREEVAIQRKKHCVYQILHALSDLRHDASRATTPSRAMIA